jgi:hypothetical protein
MKSLAIGFTLGLLVAAAICYWRQPVPAQIEAPTTALRQADGSLVLERAATNPKAKPAASIPKGGKAERVISVDIQSARTDCPVCTVDLTVVRMADDSRRVVASSPTGPVLGGLDIPMIPLVDHRHSWTIGASRGTAQNSWGIWVDREFGPFRAGVEANRIGVDSAGSDKYEARVRLGVQF